MSEAPNRAINDARRPLWRRPPTTRCTSASDTNAPCTRIGTDVPGWKYRRAGVLFTNRRGVANSWARARGFKVDPTVEYFVGVFDSTNRLVACAQLTTKHKAKKPHAHGPGAKPHGKPDKPHGNSNAQGPNDDPGKSKTVGGDNGQGKDHGRGNDDKPRDNGKPHGQGHDKDHG